METKRKHTINEEQKAAAQEPDKVRTSSTGLSPDTRGSLSPVAARIIMKVLYGARMARPDLLRAVNRLARFVTRWSVDCDRRLHRLMCDIAHSLHLRQVGWVGDPVAALYPHLYADADLAGCTETLKSTSGAVMCDV